MATNEKTSAEIASIASRGLQDPLSLTLDEIRAVCGSVLTQAPDHSNALARAMGTPRPGLGVWAAQPKNYLADAVGNVARARKGLGNALTDFDDNK